MAIEWFFPSNGDAEIDGFNNASMDTFRGHMVFSLVRETIQNSLDARKSKLSPVTVNFSIDDIEMSQAIGVSQLSNFFLLALKTAIKQLGEKSDAAKTFSEGLHILGSEKKVRIFAIHDSNTLGLAGPVSHANNGEKPGSWLALVKGSGLSIKQSGDALGSFGHGSKAPLAISKLRSVFYFTEIEVGNLREKRFQGKSILQSMEIENNGMTQGTGYFGHKEKLMPLINDDIPKWALNLRNQTTPDTGTSIYIPYPDIPDDTDLLWNLIEYSVLTNFYLAIKNGNLRIIINNKILDSYNVSEALESLIKNKVIEKLENHPDFVDDYGEKIHPTLTVHSPTSGLQGLLISKSFGQVEWYMRIGSDLNRRSVGIARQNGMLISTNAPNLERFQGTKPFDLFLCVTGEPGATILRKSENPAHTNFEFDRIKDSEERKIYLTTYKKFVKEVRELIALNAAIETSNEEYVDDLDEFFGGYQNDSNETIGVEKTYKLKIHEKRKAIPKNQNIADTGSDSENTENSEISEGLGDLPNQVDGGDKGFHGKKGNIQNQSVIFRPLNQRIVKDNLNENAFNIYFDAPTSNECKLSIHRTGQTESEHVEVALAPDSSSVKFLDLGSIIKGKRMQIRVYVDEFEFRFAHEVRIHVKK